MDIKLNARLSAYSKLDVVSSSTPDFDIVTHEQIDSLFESVSSEREPIEENNSSTNRVSRSAIDSLFTWGDTCLVFQIMELLL